MLTSQHPGVSGYDEGLHAEAGAGHGTAGSRLNPRPWPMPRPPGPGLRAEHGNPRTARTPARLQRRELRAGGRPVAARGATEREALIAANALAVWSAALYNLTTGRCPTQAEAGPAFQADVLPSSTAEGAGAWLRRGRAGVLFCASEVAGGRGMEVACPVQESRLVIPAAPSVCPSASSPQRLVQSGCSTRAGKPSTCRKSKRVRTGGGGQGCAFILLAKLFLGYRRSSPASGRRGLL